MINYMVSSEIIEGLFECNCIKTGAFTLRSGELSKYYFDMKNLVSYPSLLRKIGDEIYELIKTQGANIICGVPIGGLPLCTYISVTYDIPMIMVRNEVKAYGTSKQIEGNYKSTDKCIIIEDVVTTGGSLENVVNILKDKVNVISSVVILDRQQGHSVSVPINSLINKTDITRYALSKIMKEKKSRLCFSADIYVQDKLLRILDDVGPYIVICKIHYDCYKHNNDLKFKLIELSVKHKFMIMEDRKFADISYIVQRQYKQFSSWIDLVTVMGNVNSMVLSQLSGALLVANMSNNDFDFTDKAIETSRTYPGNIIGFITQKRIYEPNMLCMTPGINIANNSVDDQNYRKVSDVDTDIIIVGRGIYLQDDYVSACKTYSAI